MRNVKPEPRPKPRKRPSQARAKFTVLAIYEAFVRIWQLRGWARLSTRAVALETGVSVGTLYEYFPNKDALLSGYVRHCIDWMLDCIDREVIAATSVDWRDRIALLVRITCGTFGKGSPYYDQKMLLLETRIAEVKHHRRVFDELFERWQRAFGAFEDAPTQLDGAAIRSLLLLAMGARRYSLLIEVSDDHAWITDVTLLCIGRIESQARLEALQ